MANKRDIKKGLNNMIFEIVDDCFSAQLFNDSKAEASEKLINEAADFQDTMLARINKAKSKAEFRAIHTEIEDKGETFFHAVNSL
jgi:hypothetical protein